MKTFLFLFISLISLSLQNTVAQERLALKAEYVFSSNGEMKRGWGVLIEDGVIVQVDDFEKLSLDANTTVQDYPHHTLIPGLIEAHSHLFLHPYNETLWDDQVLRESQGRRIIRALNHAKSTLQAGFTTMRDLGTEGAGYADVEIRDAINAGEVIGPRLKVATKAIVAYGAYAPVRKNYGFMSDLHQGAQEVSGVEEAKKAVREQIQNGADWIKVYADFEVGPAGKTVPTFTQQELNEIVSLAHQLGRPVSAHAISNDGMQRAISAGVDSIEHGLWGTRETFKMMAQKNIAWLPTITQVEAYAEYFEGYRIGDPASQTMQQIAWAFAIAMQEQVLIGVGSDVGVYRHGDNFRELDWMRKLGMTPQQVLIAVTQHNATILKMQNKLGQLNAGYLADIVVLEANPLNHFEVLQSPVAVYKDGKLVFTAQN